MRDEKRQKSHREHTKSQHRPDKMSNAKKWNINRKFDSVFEYLILDFRKFTSEDRLIVAILAEKLIFTDF